MIVSPGASSTPAIMEPSITVLAPPTNALTISPEYLIPPSAIRGILFLCVTSATSIIAVSWGTPIPAIILVVHIEPGPIPTLTASAPASINACAAAPVAIFPITTSKLGKEDLTDFKTSITPLVCPCAVSIIIASTETFTRAETLSRTSLVIPTAAATLNLPYLSLDALGRSLFFMMSLKVISPTNLLSASTIGNFSILLSFNIFSASSNWSKLAVINLFLVITEDIPRLMSFSNLKSLLVAIPKRFESASIIGIPPILFSCIIVCASPTVADIVKVIGSRIIPLSERFTFLTSWACCLIVMFLWRTPIPPSWAIAIAISDSVTVSIAAETIGTFKVIFLVNLVAVSTICGSTSE